MKKRRSILSVKTAAVVNLLSGSLFAGCVAPRVEPDCDLGHSYYCDEGKDFAVPDLSERDQKPPSED